ncbi:hypothetical protein VTK26DRAFT_7906 [Humicola hyalothermophila]
MDYARLRAAAMSGADEEAVTVDTRALIDKVLARYSGEWTTLRELIQNAADAQATTVKVKWETLPSTQVPLPTTTNQSDLIKHAITHHTLRRLVVQNDGQPFSKTDWARLKKIAEGNPDETKIGAFGVGFYSVFADCEEPFVSSGSEAMAFYWKGNALFTRKVTLPPGEGTKDTAFVLDYRNTTTPVPNLLSVSQFLATSLTFVALQNIELWIDDWKILALHKKSSPKLDIPIPRDFETKTKDGLMKLSPADRTSTQIDATFMSVIGWKPQATSSATKSTEPYSTSELPSLKSFFSKFTSASSLRHKVAKEEKTVQEAIAQDVAVTSTSSIFLRVTSGQIATSVSSSFAAELERATKKPPPKMTKISILTSSYDETVASETSSSSQTAKAANVFASVLPSKKPGGRIFIGFPTTQTTGAGMHISAPSVIPTVEREAIDLNARWVRTWNMELLRAAGIMSRLAFANEMADLNDKLKRMSNATDKKTSVISPSDVQKCVPEALHILKTYTFQDSTPSARVAEIIEEAWWTAYKQPSIEVYSSKGVLPTTKVRLSSEDISKFAPGVPVILDEMKQAPVIKKLVESGLIHEVEVDDICQELAAKALDKNQLHHFLQWITARAYDGQFSRADVRRLLDVTVATITEGGNSGDIIALGSIENYPNNKIPAALPIPPTTLPAMFSAKIPEARLQSLGWEPLGIVPWLRFLIESAPGKADEQNLTKSDKFAQQVLTVLSKNWDNLSLSSKSSVVSALENITVMPTKGGMKKPGESFFPSVKLFDDLPTLEGCANLKEKFLTALGVRKTVDLETIFTRLLSPPPTAGDGSRAKWSHMELIKYLASVKDDIPAADMKRLRESPICPAEAGPRGLEPTKGTAQLYKVSELFEPKDTLRALKLPLLQWPGPPGSFRNTSAEARFLYTLGLRPYPSVPELVNMMASSDDSLRHNAMSYFIGNHHTNGYSSFDMWSIDKCILPIEGNEKKLVRPSACYTNPRAAVLGYDILRKDLHQHSMKFGVARDPPITGCVEKLISNPPRDRTTAITLFEYFSTRVGDLGHNSLVKLRDAAFVPVMRSKHGRHSADEKPESTLVHVRPQHCYLGSSSTYKDIFDFVDYGPDANTFLFKCGAKNEPTKHEIAQLACSEPARLLSVLQSPEKYLHLLKSIAEDLSTLRRDKELYKKMKTSNWLLGFRELTSGMNKQTDGGENDEAPIKHYQLATPEEIVIQDDYISFRLFKEALLCAPEDDGLESFYISLGSDVLSNRVKEDLWVGNRIRNQAGAEWLRKHVIERSKLFLHEYTKDKPGMIKHDAKWLEKHLQVVSVSSLNLRRTLKGHPKSHNEKRSAASTMTDGAVLYVAAQDQKPNMYQVGQAICQFLLTRHSQSAYIVFEPFLKLGLLELRERGYNVDRILRAKEAEARLAEEERRRALEEEQKKIEERQKEWAAQNTAAEAAREELKTPPRGQNRMPGGFDDSPEDQPSLLHNLPHQHKRPRGIFSTISRHLGFDTGGSTGSSSPQSDIDNFLPAAPEQQQQQKPDDGSVTSPAVVHQNLLNAIKSTRPHGSADLFSPPKQTEVKEQSSYCDNQPAHNITFAAEAPRGMRVFLANDLSTAADRGAFLAQRAEAIALFEGLLRDVAAVYGLSERALHIFYDDKGSTIAFNSERSLFCNGRFFEKLHLQGLRPGGGPQARVEAATWWWVVLAHELAHNLVGPHNAEHSYYTESFIQQYFPKMMVKATAWMAAASGSGAESATAAGAGESSAQAAEAPPPYSL